MVPKPPTTSGQPSPTEYIRYIEAILPLLESDRVPTNLPMRNCGDGPSLESALNALQNSGLKVEWILRARVQWVELVLRYWSYEVRTKAIGQYIKQVTHMPPDNGQMTLEGIGDYITTAYVREHRNRLLDKYQGILRVVRGAAQASGDDAMFYFISRLLTKTIVKRFGCMNLGDPTRDEMACQMMFRTYFGENRVDDLFEQYAAPK